MSKMSFRTSSLERETLVIKNVVEYRPQIKNYSTRRRHWLTVRFLRGNELLISNRGEGLRRVRAWASPVHVI